MIKLTIENIRTDIKLYFLTKKFHYAKRAFKSFAKINNTIEFKMLKDTVKWN